jgi:hypothetical protein
LPTRDGTLYLNTQKDVRQKKEMRISEIVGLYTNQEETELVPVSGALQGIANAFTRSGKVKRPLDLQQSNNQPTPTFTPSLSLATPERISGAPTSNGVASTRALVAAIPQTTD